jgi:UDP-galactopyranose mutase
MYDYLIVGSGLFGCTFANLAARDKKKCLIIEKRNHPFGNCYTEQSGPIDIHKYGPHIFHTNNGVIWDYINQFTKFNHFINRPKVKFKDSLFSFPINLMTLHQLWGVSTPDQAIKKLNEVKIQINNPANLEEWALSQVGQEIYEIFIKGYTTKQWNTDPKNLPSFIIQRLPIRLNFDDNYFFDKYQGIPINGYSQMMQNMIEGIEIVLGTNYLDNREKWDKMAKYIIYTGPIDEYFDNSLGVLDYRSLRFEHIHLDQKDFQGNAIINYTEENVPYTRIIEHKHFTFVDSNRTLITKEYPQDWTLGGDRYYPINNSYNNDLYEKYKLLVKKQNNIVFGGRLAEYKYYDMHQIIGSAMTKYKKLIH